MLRYKQISGIRMNMNKQLYIDAFNSYGIGKGSYTYALADKLASTIPYPSIPYRMKLALSYSELCSLVSQFRHRARIWNDSLIPVNNITFCIAPSGAHKDSSRKALKLVFNDAYRLLAKLRHDENVEQAITIAIENEIDEVVANKPKAYEPYLRDEVSPFIGISTKEGLLQTITDLQVLSFGSCNVYNSEFGLALLKNGDALDNLEAISIMYDLGEYESKALKAKELQLARIEGFPCNALFISSPNYVLENVKCKETFKLCFESMLARRSNFIYVKEKYEEPEFASYDDKFAWETKLNQDAQKCRSELSEWLVRIVYRLSNPELKEQIYDDFRLPLESEARKVMLIYEDYTKSIAEDRFGDAYSISSLSYQHSAWRAMKTAMVIALSNKRSDLTITVEDMLAGIEFQEMISEDFYQFEQDLAKEPYQLFVEYTQKRTQDCSYTAHELIQHGFIVTKAGGSKSITSKMKELALLANTYNKTGIYHQVDDHIDYKHMFSQEESLYVSYKMLPVSWKDLAGTGKITKQIKNSMGARCTDGFTYVRISFEQIAKMVQQEVAFLPYELPEGKRQGIKDNSSKWVVLDVDDSSLSDYELHELLDDKKHIIVRTSDPDNQYKYRVILELDKTVRLSSTQYNDFILEVAKSQTIRTDPLPQSQIFFTYGDRQMYVNLDGQCIDTEPILQTYKETTVMKDKVSDTLKKSRLENRTVTFLPAIEAPFGQGRKKLTWAWRYAANDLGANADYCHELVNFISQTCWNIQPLPANDTNAIHRQIDKLFCCDKPQYLI